MRSAGRTRVALWRQRQGNREPSHRRNGRSELFARSTPCGVAGRLGVAPEPLFLEPPSPGEEVFLSAGRCPISVTVGRPTVTLAV